VRLLIDENLSWKLIRDLSSVYPDPIHVRDVGLASADDSTIWAYARANALTIVTKDLDFHQRSFLHGAPPRVIWICRGNCSTAEVIEVLRSQYDVVRGFHENSEASFLVLG
jgi:predicted nuclease of predicted toxin-antitoxin system